MIKHQEYNMLPVQVGGLTLQDATSRGSVLNIIRRNPQHLVKSASKISSRRHSYHHQRHLQQHSHLHQNQRPMVVRASEYKNLRQVVPSLRRQRDVGKVEVVTEAARYIDHLHKTLIERFVICGIPESLKDILGTDDANELSSLHIMNLVTKMAQKQPAGSRRSGLVEAHDGAPGSTRTQSRLCSQPAGQQHVGSTQASTELAKSASSRRPLLAAKADCARDDKRKHCDD